MQNFPTPYNFIQETNAIVLIGGVPYYPRKEC